MSLIEAIVTRITCYSECVHFRVCYELPNRNFPSTSYHWDLFRPMTTIMEVMWHSNLYVTKVTLFLTVSVRVFLSSERKEAGSLRGHDKNVITSIKTNSISRRCWTLAQWTRRRACIPPGCPSFARERLPKRDFSYSTIRGAPIRTVAMKREKCN